MAYLVTIKKGKKVVSMQKYSQKTAAQRALKRDTNYISYSGTCVRTKGRLVMPRRLRR